jgi:hypothetical protein
MTTSKYIWADRLAWIGFFGSFLFGAIELFGQPNSTGLVLPFSQEVLRLAEVLHLASIGAIVYGCALALRSKSRSLFWLLLLTPALVTPIGPMMMIIIFALKDKTLMPPSLHEPV